VTVFNAYEIFEIAEQIERNGGRFYRKAAEAEALSNRPVSDLLLSLASMEDEHVKIFRSMKETLSGQRWAEGFEAENEAVLFLRAMAGGEIFTDRDDPAARVSGMSLADMLTVAIGLEKDSVAYYTGMRAVVPEGLGKEKIDAIIKEEMRHAALLQRELERVK
jgi:rubrerythrin